MMVKVIDENYTVFQNTNEMFLYLACELERYSHLSATQHISLSGGSTPKGLFRYLVSSDFKERINWANLHFWWGDERCVAFSDEQSNYGEAKRLLFDHINIPKQNVHFIPLDLENSIEDYELVAEAYALKMKQHMQMENNYPIYDWILLGVGTDGHTASLFPSASELNREEVALSVLKPNTNEFRVTISANTIRKARRISYLVTGLSKAEVIAEILTKQGRYQEYPAAFIQSTSGMTEYLLDVEASQGIH